MTDNKEITEFSAKILKAGQLPNITSALLIFLYSSFFMGLRPAQTFWALVISAAVVALAQFILSPITNPILTKELSKNLSDWEERGETFTDDERTQLFEQALSFPQKKSFETYLYFFACSTVIFIGLHFIPLIGISFRTSFICYIVCILASYFAAIFAFAYSEGICSDYARKIIRQGVNNKYVSENRPFGLSTINRAIFYLIIPSLVTTLLTFLIMAGSLGEINGTIPSASQQISKISVISSINVLICLILCYMHHKNIKAANKKLEDSLLQIIHTGSISTYTDTDLGDKIQYNIFLLNKTMGRFKKLLEKSSKIGSNVLKTIDDLSVISKELSSTAISQSASVKEINTTMEDSNAFSQNIARRITNVSMGTEETFNDVSSGSTVIQEILEQMVQINSANESIINGIKDLSRQIDSIGNVISIINDIADQTKIIAFNAELEAVSAGNEGHNFHIVATEIRRLANSTTSSIKEINANIENIKSSANNLIDSSQTLTGFINDERGLAAELEDYFSQIKDTADQTSSKASEITSIVEQQTNSFGQIVTTLKQIGEGIDSFASSTKAISTTAESVQAIASKLGNISLS